MNNLERMRRRESLLSYEDVSQLLELVIRNRRYCLVWKVNRSNVSAGTIAGYLRSDGYLQGKINNNGYLGHRVAWLLYYGEWPESFIDHEDGDKSSLDPSNLQLVSQAMNCRNAKMHRNNSSGHTGVIRRGNKWRAYIIGYNGVLVHLGTFANEEKAIAARQKAEVEYGFTERHGK